MSQLLRKIEADLSELEETLLAELRRLRKTAGDEVYADLSDDVAMQVRLTADSLKDVLNSSGDASNLSLKTEQHENLEARIGVLSQLLSKKIPAVFIETSHQEVKASRQQLTAKVAASRSERKADPENKKPGLFKRIFSREETSGEQARNPDHVTQEEQNKFEADQGYKDSGVFSASRELAILCEQVRLHVDEGQSIEKVAQERAKFRSKDLSSDPPEFKDIAQSPEAIRKKLQNRGAAPSGKSSTFVAKDIQPVADPEPPRKREKKAQSPEEIRRKLEARKSEDSAGAGKAVFGAKDLSNAPPPVMPDPVKREPARKEPEPAPEPTTGKAVFGSKDIEPEFERFDQARARREAREAEKKEAARKSGKATFKSKDLDDPKN